MLSNVAKTFFLVMVAMVLISAPALAAEPEATDAAAATAGAGWGKLAAGLGAGLATIGGAFGIGKLAAAALEGTARQPEASGDLRTTMIIAAALIEGFTFFAIVVTLLLT